MMMKIVVLLAVVSFACALDKSVYKEWKSHVAKYNRKFSNSQETRKSFQNFARSYENVLKQNNLYSAGLSTYRAALNKFSDADSTLIRNITGLIDADLPTPHLFKRELIGHAKSPVMGFKIKYIKYNPNKDTLLDSVDYSKQMGKVRDQKTCGSCYAHATMKAVEMNIRKYYSKSYNLAPQQLVDCSHKQKSEFGNLGCDGGIIYNSMDFVEFITDYEDHKCLAIEDDMPYKNAYVSSRDCKNLCKTNNKVPFEVSAYEINHAKDLGAIKKILERGPAFAQVYVDEDFMRYESGIFTKPTSESGRVNHAVVAVGFGKDKDQNGKEVEYIKILNSWGPDWGEDGCIRVNVNSIHVTDVMARPFITKQKNSE